MLSDLLEYEDDVRNRRTAEYMIPLSLGDTLVMQKSIPKLEQLGRSILPGPKDVLYKINPRIRRSWLVRHQELSYFIVQYKHKS